MMHRDARNMVQETRANSHLKILDNVDKNIQYKRQVNEEKDQWKQDRLSRESQDFAYRKGIHDHVHSTDVAAPRRACDDDKQKKMEQTRSHLRYELADHSRVIGAHDAKMDSYQSLEHSMIENVNKSQGEGKQAQEDLEL